MSAHEHSGFVVLRTPLLPFDELVRWADGLEERNDPEARAELRARLRALVARPHVREAIFVASPALHELIPRWLEQPESERGEQCERALVRYVARMSGRSTPFGLFAGVSTAAIAGETSLVLGGRSGYRRATRLDAGYLADVVGGLLEQPARRERLTYVPNASLYRCGDRRRYVRSRPAAEEDRHLLVSVRDSETLDATLAAAARGASPLELRSALAAAGHDEQKVATYVDELIEQQVLVPSGGLRITGGDATLGLGGLDPALADARAELARLDGEGIGADPRRYEAIVARLRPLPAEARPEHLFQVDTAKPAPDATLGTALVNEILRGADLLRRISYRDATTGAVARFAERFTQRFEGRAVPLLEALDPDLGVAFDDEPAATPLLAGIAAADGRPSERRWGAREDHLLARLLEAQATGTDELVLGPRDLERLRNDDAPPLPDAFAVLATVAAASDAALTAGRFRVLVHGVSGPSGARLLGRFCHADPALEALVREHLRAEEALDPDAIFAEVVHLPRARDGNVSARPVLRDHELDCLGGAGGRSDRRIPLDDLLVSVDAGRVLLHSRRLGRRIVPRLTSAHNYSSRGMAAYRFLCALQNQGAAGELELWGPLAAAPALPRVRCGRLVLSCARWRLEADAVGDGFAAVQAWRRERRVPRFVASLDYGGQLPVDLDNALSVESLLHLVRRQGSATLAEFFPPPGELRVTGPEGAFAHELVVPFVRAAPAPARRTPAPVRSARRRFIPGGEWLYVRLYTGETIADAVLTKAVAPLVRDLVDGGLAHRWFFLRYADPQFHLRVRFHGEPATLRKHVLPAVEHAGRRLVDDGLVWRVELGTYEREVERYGGPEAIELAEAVFHADSDAVVSMLPLLDPGAAGQEERWQLGVVGVHRLLADLGLDDCDRLALVEARRDALAASLRWNGAARGRIGERFRSRRAELERLLDAEPGDGHPLEPGRELLRARSARLAPIADELTRLEGEGRLSLARAELAGSLLHMHLNRLLRGNNLAQELVVCDFLARLYRARRTRVLTG